jgi:hypothetical protein
VNANLLFTTAISFQHGDPACSVAQQNLISAADLYTASLMCLTHRHRHRSRSPTGASPQQHSPVRTSSSSSKKLVYSIRPARGSSSSNSGGDAWGTTTQTLRYSDATELAAGDTLPATTRSGLTTVAAWGESSGGYSNARSSNGRAHSATAATAATAAAVAVLRRSSVSSSSTSSSSRRYSKAGSPVKAQQEQFYYNSSEAVNPTALYDAVHGGSSNSDDTAACTSGSKASKKHKQGGDLAAAERRAFRRGANLALAATSLTVTEPTVSSSSTVVGSAVNAAVQVGLWLHRTCTHACVHMVLLELSV